jgi:hypothetical protein
MENSMSHRVYSIGYRGWNERDFVLAAKGIVIDCRFQPFSGGCFSRQNLREIVPYRWCPAAGNVTYKSSAININDKAKAIELIEEVLQTSDVTLLCCCARLESCHVMHLIWDLQRDGFEWERIVPPKRDSAQMQLL